MAYRIRELREKKKLTQEQLAQMSGVSRTTIVLLENNEEHGPGGGCIKHNRQRNRSSIGGLPWNKYDYEHL